jgi:hypothetical protein
MNRIKIIFIAMIFLGVACNEQHNPREDWKQFKNERTIAHSAQPKLTDKGTIPGAADVVKIDIAKRYQILCTSCHGAQGKGDGAAATALAVPPRNFVDKKWQSSVDDKRIYTVIAKGGAAVGLDASMAPWSAILSEEEMTLMVGYIRKLGK